MRKLGQYRWFCQTCPYEFHYTKSDPSWPLEKVRKEVLMCATCMTVMKFDEAAARCSANQGC